MTLFTLNYFLAIGTILAQVGVVIAVIDLVFFKGKYLAVRIAPHALPLALLVAAGATAFTLIYSGIYQIAPCPLCWWQRIFLYPQILLVGLGMWFRDVQVTVYGGALSVVGLLVSLYHHALQIFPGSLPCPAEALCAQRHIFEFGYITFPLMAATVFAVLIVLFISSKRTA